LSWLREMLVFMLNIWQAVLEDTKYFSDIFLYVFKAGCEKPKACLIHF